ncbi:MAG: alpha/beta fold hydrolase, partial [Casimicrobiaceae bacterium]
LFADDVAAFMDGAGITSAHVAGMSLGSATATWLAAKYPAKVRTLAIHSSRTVADRYLRDVLESWCVLAGALSSALQAGIRGSELVLLDGCAHAAISEDPETFNRVTLDFLTRHA